MFYKTLVMQSQLDNPISPLDTCASGLVWSVASLDRTLSKKKKNLATVLHELHQEPVTLILPMTLDSWLPS